MNHDEQTKTTIQLIKSIAAFALVFNLFSCANAPEIRISSNPEGADILNKNVIIGHTPAVFKKSQISSSLQSNSLAVTLRLTGYEEKSTILKVDGDSAFKFELQALGDKSFQNQTMFLHPKEANRLMRELLTCQGLVFAQKFDEAEKSIKRIQADYPGVASAYVLEANIYILKDESGLAISAIKKAVQLDPDDTAAQRLYLSLQTRAPAAVVNGQKK